MGSSFFGPRSPSRQIAPHPRASNNQRWTHFIRYRFCFLRESGIQFLTFSALIPFALAKQSSLDGSKLLSYTADSSGVFNVATPSGNPTVTVNLATSYQPMDGNGVALSDASAYNMQQGKSSDSTAYKNWLSMMFDKYTGLSIIRVPIGATDFSQSVYTLADKVPTIDPIANPVGCMAQVFDPSNAGQKSLPTGECDFCGNVKGTQLTDACARFQFKISSAYAPI